MSITSEYRTLFAEGRSERVKVNFSVPADHDDESFQNIYKYFNWAPHQVRFERKIDNGKGARNQWKDWQHYCVAVSNNGSGCGVNATTTAYSWDYTHHIGTVVVNDPYCFYNWTYGDPGCLNTGLPEFYVPSEAVGFVPAPAGLNGMLATAIGAMIPKIKPDVMSLNSIYELKDFKSVPRTLTHCKAILDGSFKTLRDRFRSYADVYLQYKFNVGPLIRDVTALFAVMSRVEKQLNRFITQQGRVQTAHWSKKLNEFSNVQETAPNASLSNIDARKGWMSDMGALAGTATCERFVNYDPTEFHVELQYSYHYADYQTEHARLLGLLDSLGVNLNPAIIWNAIPWSFVVDWVAGVSRWLNQNRIGFMDPSVCIRRALWSVRRHRRILAQNHFAFISEGGGNLFPQTVPMPMVEEESYRRQLFNPLHVGFASFETSGISLVEASLASALAVSRKRSHYRPR